MNYKNKYEYLNQEIRLPLLKMLEKYHLSPKDKEKLENILWYMFNQYDEATTLNLFYEKKYGTHPEDFKEYLDYYNKTHTKIMDYRMLSQKSVYDEGYDEDRNEDYDYESCKNCPDRYSDECPLNDEDDYDESCPENEELASYDAEVDKKLDELLDDLFDEITSASKPKEYFIEDVIFNDPCTIVFWSDGTKTTVKCGENDTFDKEKGLAMAIIKKIVGNNKGAYNEIFKEYCLEKEKLEEGK